MRGLNRRYHRLAMDAPRIAGRARPKHLRLVAPLACQVEKLTRPFVALGWTGDLYSPIALCVGAIVCIAAANAGTTSQDLKTGYIVGATPVYQQIGLIIGVLASGLIIGLTTLYMHEVFGIGSAAVPAPQATLMSTIITGLLNQNLPWGLVLVHVAVATAIWAGVVALAARLLLRSQPRLP